MVAGCRAMDHCQTTQPISQKAWEAAPPFTTTQVHLMVHSASHVKSIPSLYLSNISLYPIGETVKKKKKYLHSYVSSSPLPCFSFFLRKITTAPRQPGEITSLRQTAVTLTGWWMHSLGDQPFIITVVVFLPVTDICQTWALIIHQNGLISQ